MRRRTGGKRKKIVRRTEETRERGNGEKTRRRAQGKEEARGTRRNMRD